MEPWQILVAVASFGLVGITVVLARSGMVPPGAAMARVCGYAVTGALAILGVSPILAIVPAALGVVVSYLLVLRAHRADRTGG